MRAVLLFVSLILLGCGGEEPDAILFNKGVTDHLIAEDQVLFIKGVSRLIHWVEGDTVVVGRVSHLATGQPSRVDPERWREWSVEEVQKSLEADKEACWLRVSCLPVRGEKYLRLVGGHVYEVRKPIIVAYPPDYGDLYVLELERGDEMFTFCPTGGGAKFPDW